MAFQRSMMKLEGRIEDLTFYQSWYGFAARKKTGVSGERLKNDPVFVRARENMSEFGRSGKATKLIRAAFKISMLEVADVRFTQRLVQTIMRIIKSDTVNNRGERLLIKGDVTQLLSLEFNAAASLAQCFFAGFTPTIDRPTGSLTVEIPEFVPGDNVMKPAGATHFQLIASAADLDFDLEQRVSRTTSSAYLAIDSQKEHLKLLCELPPASRNTLVLALGIQFFQESNGSYYPIQNKAHNAMKFVAVDVA